MLTVHKYKIPKPKKAVAFSIDLPKGAKILTVQSQNNKPQIWILLNSARDLTETRNFFVMVTGGLIMEEKELNYVGTFQMDEGNFVGHVFETKS